MINKSAQWKNGARARLERKSKTEALKSFPRQSRMYEDAAEGYESMCSWLACKQVFDAFEKDKQND